MSPQRLCGLRNTVPGYKTKELFHLAYLLKSFFFSANLLVAVIAAPQGVPPEVLPWSSGLPLYRSTRKTLHFDAQSVMQLREFESTRRASRWEYDNTKVLLVPPVQSPSSVARLSDATPWCAHTRAQSAIEKNCLGVRSVGPVQSMARTA